MKLKKYLILLCFLPYNSITAMESNDWHLTQMLDFASCKVKTPNPDIKYIKKSLNGLLISDYKKQESKNSYLYDALRKNYLASDNLDRCIYFKGNPISNSLNKDITCVAFSTEQGFVRIMDFNACKKVMTIQKPEKNKEIIPVTALAFNHDSSQLVTADKRGTIRIYSIDTNSKSSTLKSSFESNESDIKTICFDFLAKYIVAIIGSSYSNQRCAIFQQSKID